MEWPKLKNIIIVILLITNLFLLGLVGLQGWNSSNYQAQAREDALQVLEQNGIHMQAETLPQDRSLTVAAVSRDREAEGALMERLLGKRAEDGSEGGDPMYTGEKGETKLGNRGEFQISLKPGAYPVTGALADHALALLERMEMQAVVLSSEGDAEDGVVTLLQLWNGVPVRTCRITVRYAGAEKPVVIAGTRISGTPVTTGEVELSAVTGLLRFLEKFSDTGDVCNEILVMQAGYQMLTGLSDPATLTPIWYFVTDSGAYTLDVMANQLKKL